MSRALSEQPFEFGAWRVEPARGVLAPLDGGAGETRIEPRLMDLLLLFAGSGGRVVGKQEIVDGVWGGRAIGDDTLAAAVSRLRSALGETPARRYIETLPKRGYRLVMAPPEGSASGPASRSESNAPPKAAALLAQGRAALANPFPASQAQARLYFEAAVAEAPGWAPAHAGLANALAAQYLAGGGGGSIAAAKACAHAAVGLDPELAPAWAVLGLAILMGDRDFAAADQALRRALALDPDLASAHRHRAFGFAAVGQFVEAERAARRAVELEPVSLMARGQLLQILLTARRYRQAIAAANEALALAPLSSEGWYAKGWAYALSGEPAAAAEGLLKGLELWGLDQAQLDILRARFDEGGFAALSAAGADLFQTQKVMFTPRLTDVAFLRAAAGQPDAAFAALEAAATQDDPYLTFLPWLPYCDPLRDDPRWPRLLEKVRLIR
ncbi:winged helix-turn-helix domain-containing protein [Phenylobacterium sp.]|jgi:DNA-binding winged helix-turn-helix (wHTH) protein/Flp pilus assembly protein TadD|uniref:winged helix-turn-helix domain-containing protein n=1 Tax=Phenylobacterium sp. TaxID=1871053 RepID=UPI002F416FEE